MDQKIKIVLAINNMARGGAQRLLVDQLRFFNPDFFEFYLVTLFEDKNRQDFFAELPQALPVYRLNFKNFFDFKNWRLLISVIKKIQPQLVLSSLFFSNTVLRLLKLLFGYQVIIVEHNTYAYKKYWQVLVDRCLAKLTYKIVAVSETVKSFTSRQEKINPDKFTVIANGIDLFKIAEKIKDFNKEFFKAELGFAPDDHLIINAARLIKQKNQSLLLEAFSKFSLIKNNYRLIILGEGPLKKALEEQVSRLALSGKVFFLGEVEEVYPYYAISDFFVLTSLIEGFGLVLIEAMACGLPAVSTFVAGPDKFVQDNLNGFLAESNSDDLCQKMLRLTLLTPEQLLKIKQNCLQTAQEFDIKKNVLSYEKLFLAALKNR